MPAAIDAHDVGADVLIIEKWDELGGSCRRCGGAMIGADTVVQRALGVEDSPDALYEYVVACGEGWTDPALHRVYADNAGKNIDWMIEDLGGQPVSEWKIADEEMGGGPGLNLHSGLGPIWYERFGMEPVLRCHWFTPVGEPWMGSPYAGGTALFAILDDAIQAREIRTMLGTGLTGLVAGADREVLGVKASSGDKTLYLKARKGVVLATGGWIHNSKMVRDYVPSFLSMEAPADIEHPDHAHGEGVIATQAIGADLTNVSVTAIGLECDG